LERVAGIPIEKTKGSSSKRLR